MRRPLSAALALLAAACGAPGQPAGPTAASLDAGACPTAHAAPPADAEKLGAAIGKPVTRVCIVGTSGEARAAAESAIVAKAGDTLAAEPIRRDLEKAMATGLFDDGRAWLETTSAGATLVYDFVERPRIASIAFQGSKVFGDEALHAKLPVAKGGPYDPAKMLLVATTLEDEYHVRGYLAAGVQLKAVPGTGPTVDVHYTVIEGPLHRLAKLAAKGAKRIPEAEVLKASDLTKGEPYTRAKVERASLLVQAAYYDRGMVNAKVDVERDESTDAVGVTFAIDEGPVFTIGKIAFKNAKSELEKDLLARLKVKPGQVFSRKTLIDELDRLSKFLGEKNLHGSLTPSVEIDAKKSTIDVAVTIDFQQ